MTISTGLLCSLNAGGYLGDLLVSLDGQELRRVVGFVAGIASALRWAWLIGHMTSG